MPKLAYIDLQGSTHNEDTYDRLSLSMN